MKKYMFQRFLANGNTDNISLEKLFTDKYEDAHLISVSDLDQQIDTEIDLAKYLEQFDPNELLILKDDRTTFSNPIICDYAKKTLKSYLFWISQRGYNCLWTNSAVD